MVFIFLSCAKEEKTSNISFYYWKSKTAPGKTETECLRSNHCKRLYVRYFDVVLEEGEATPVSVIDYQPPTGVEIMPVIYIENKVFENASKTSIDKLYANVKQLVTEINAMHKITMKELQVDCDWAKSTKENYFYFLEKFKAENLPVSATIRLHQVKYSSVTGIPPVNRGVLMYYNMGKINADTLNSIYDAGIAQKYISSLKTYPLPLEVALPVFVWGIQSRDGKVVNLLNKTSGQDFVNDTCFTPLPDKTLKAMKSCFKNGYYFQANDVVKLESVSEEQLKTMASTLSKAMKTPPSEIIFYDLDSLNLKRYNEKIFEQARNSFY